jgi:hypothetical protein
MKKLLVSILFIALVGFGALYTYQSGLLFLKGFNELKSEQNLSAGIAFAELIEEYPYSPFLSVGRVYLVSKDSRALPLLDVFFKTREKGDVFSRLVGKSPAYYDPFFFAGACFFLLISMIGVLKRYWAGSIGVSIKGLIFRDGYMLVLCVLYYLWIHGSINESSLVYQSVGAISGFLNEPLGVSLVTLGFAAVMLVSIILAILLGLIGMIPRKTSK